MSINEILQNMSRRKMIGQGVYRRVYDLGNGYVLKVAKSKAGRRSNKKEVKLYLSSPYRVRKYLGKIVGFKEDYSSLIMKKYDQSIPETEKYRAKCFKVTRKFRKKRIFPYDIIHRGKPNPRNVRVKPNGRIVVIDYGNFKDRR
ncbi:hypothetical protein [Brevibacillus marinus]|uniref:hypothetical protein n=1 Tax=Brevibacillus marinus TaxID=2496837 RepID=UPI000F82E7F0|nr:hypothetical protein [Brevibacillus marinus]